MNPRVTAVEYISPYLLKLTFTNNDVRQFDLKPYLHYPIYNTLQDESYCKKVKVFNNTVMWDENADFDPDTLYLESVKI